MFSENLVEKYKPKSEFYTDFRNKHSLIILLFDIAKPYNALKKLYCLTSTAKNYNS